MFGSIQRRKKKALTAKTAKNTSSAQVSDVRLKLYSEFAPHLSSDFSSTERSVSSQTQAQDQNTQEPSYPLENSKAASAQTSPVNNSTTGALGLKSLKELQEENQQLLIKLAKWKQLAERYHQEKSFLQTKVLKKKAELWSEFWSLRMLVHVLRVLKLPGVIAALLVVNAVLLGGTWLNLRMAHSKTKTLLQGEISQEESHYPFTIQVSVYESFDQAKREVLRLKKDGFNAYVSKPFQSENEAYRVYLSRFKTQQDAQNYLKKFKKHASRYASSFVRKRY